MAGEPRKPSSRPPAGAAKARPRKTAQPEGYAQLSAEDVLRSISAFSGDVSVGMSESDLLALFYRTLRDLLPGRLIAVRALDPGLARPRQVHGDDGLLPDSSALWLGQVEAGVTAPLPLFAGAVAGFAVPLLAGGEVAGDVHVNYRIPPANSTVALPVDADRALVIPLANQVAVVAHTQRLLEKTAYLQDYLEQIIDQANFLIVATDLAGQVTVWNRAMNKLTGFSRGHLLGRGLLPWLTQLDAPDIGLVMQHVSASGEPATREVRLPTQGGAMLRAAFNVVIVRGPQGQAAAILAIGQDVTALRSLQNQVVHAEKLATLGQIAAGVAHEINNPLTSIQVCAEAVLRKATAAAEGRTPTTFDASDLDRMRKIHEGADRIRRFAKDLVSYARPSGSEVESVSLNDVVAQGLSFCEHVLDSAQAEVEQDFYPDLPQIQAIRDQILQVVINLVTNAAHAVSQAGKGQIRVRTWVAGDATVGLAVSDNGAGIGDEDRSHIFEPFFSTKPAGRGTGLGLSIVRNIVFSHGGTINFQSRPGNGTTFVVTWPVNHLAPPPRPQGEKSTV